MPTAVIVDAVRTPQGRRNGALKDVHPVDLAALTLDALIQRTGLDPEPPRFLGRVEIITRLINGEQR